MSLTSYRAAPPRANLAEPEIRHASCGLDHGSKRKSRRSVARQRLFEIANGFFETPVSKPGDDLLFHCLSSSTIGAVRFHGRVRDGIGWVTDAMVTKLWDRRFEVLEIVHLGFMFLASSS